MNGNELINVIANYLQEESITDKKMLENMLVEIQSISKKIDELHKKMEEVELKYSALASSNIEVEPVSVSEKERSEINQTNEQVNYTNMFDEYLNNLAARVEYCIHPYVYDENARMENVNYVAYEIQNGNAEQYMDMLNEIIVNSSLDENMVSYINATVADLAGYSIKNEPQEINTQIEVKEQNEIAQTEVLRETDKNDKLSKVAEETHYKKLESGIFFADWINLQKIDYRVKDALSSIDYIIDEVTKKPDVHIIVDENNILGIKTSTGEQFFGDKSSGNNISNFLIEIKTLLDDDIYSESIIKCYDQVRSVEREIAKAKKNNIR